MMARYCSICDLDSCERWGGGRVQGEAEVIFAISWKWARSDSLPLQLTAGWEIPVVCYYIMIITTLMSNYSLPNQPSCHKYGDRWQRFHDAILSCVLYIKAGNWVRFLRAKCSVFVWAPLVARLSQCPLFNFSTTFCISISAWASF